jgi:hypothetical protein
MLMSELPWYHDGLLGATLEKPLSFGSSVMLRTVSHFFNFLSLFSPQFLPLFRSLRIFLCFGIKNFVNCIVYVVWRVTKSHFFKVHVD